MPEFDSSSTPKHLHEIGLDLPFIIVAGAIGEDISVAATKSGAHDFILNRNMHRLGATVEREIREARCDGKAKRRQRQAGPSIGSLKIPINRPRVA
ncbi:MAG: hypothetical protein IH872_04070 [Chloroflexi bacterium]|nr:hypothetical protein [Chloroflexota bacterium]